MKWTILTVIGAIGLYAWIAYAHMYNDRTGLTTLDPTPEVMTIADGEGGGTGLVYAALGDSLTAGTGVDQASDSYPYQLGLKLSSENNFPVTVINLGIPGAVAADVLNTEIPQLADRYTDIVTLAIGTNDVHNRTPLPEFKKTLETIVTTLHERDGQLYVINIPYLGDKRLVWSPYRSIIDRRIQAYNRVINEVADTQGVFVIDLYSETKAAAWAGGDYYSIDKFHPSAQGYLLWSSIIYDTLNH